MSVSHHTILLVEDNLDDIFFTRRAFSKAKIANPLMVVQDGEAAVHYLSGKGIYTNRERFPLPMLVFLDLKLPRRSGLEVLQWLRQQPSLKRLLVVMLTSSRENSDLNQAYDLGVNSYLVKPVAFNSLLEMVQSLNHYWLILNQNSKIKPSHE